MIYAFFTRAEWITLIVTILLGFIGFYYAGRDKRWLWATGGIFIFLLGIFIGGALQGRSNTASTVGQTPISQPPTSVEQFNAVNPTVTPTQSVAVPTESIPSPTVLPSTPTVPAATPTIHPDQLLIDMDGESTDGQEPIKGLAIIGDTNYSNSLVYSDEFGGDSLSIKFSLPGEPRSFETIISSVRTQEDPSSFMRFLINIDIPDTRLIFDSQDLRIGEIRRVICDITGAKSMTITSSTTFNALRKNTVWGNPIVRYSPVTEELPAGDRCVMSTP